MTTAEQFILTLQYYKDADKRFASLITINKF